MHRIPLLLPTPSIFWERTLPEWLLFEKTLNKPNVEETNAFMTALDAQAEYCRTQNYRTMEDIFTVVQQYLRDANSKSFEEQASKDYEMYLEVREQVKVFKTAKEELCEVYGQLTICMYMMRKLVKVKKYFRLYKKYKAKLQPHVLQQPKFVKINNYINELINEIHDIDNIVPTFLEDQCKIIPYKGFTSCSEISAASSICFHDKNGIYVKDDIDKASVLFVEDPISQSINVPFLECELCHNQSRKQMYTCLECRYKTYCSLSCLEKDKATHKDECVGYEQLTLLVLDTTSIFRVFVRISIQLYEQMFNPLIFRKLSKAEEVWNQLLELLIDTQTNGIGDLVLIKIKPNYSRLSDMQYSTLVATTFRLAVFIERKTNLIDKYYKRLHISNRQKFILIGAILMRMQCNYVQNSFDFEITRTVKNESVTQHLSLKDIKQMTENINRRHGLVTNIDKFYDIDAKRDVWQRAVQIINARININEATASYLPILRHVKSCKSIHRILSTYKDNIADLCFQSGLTHSLIYVDAVSQPTSRESAKKLCGQIADMSVEERYMFVEKFAQLFHINYAKYFLQVFRRDSEIKQVLTLYCPTLRKFNHSCEPNVEVIVLDNGTIIGKALRKIEKGEQLYVAYKANYLYHCKLERQMLLAGFDINCKCKYCKMDEHMQPVNLRLAIYCHSCKGVEITPNDIVCSLCNTRYDNLLIKYGAVIDILENEIKIALITEKSDEREIYVLYLILCSYCEKCENEIRIFMELKMANFLAVHNFAKQSYNIIKRLMENILTFYDEQLIWFTFYAEILQIIKILLFNNLEYKQLSLPHTDLFDLCSLGISIATGQKHYLEFYEAYDKDFSNVLEDFQDLLKWRTDIIRSEFPPLAEYRFYEKMEAFVIRKYSPYVIR